MGESMNQLLKQKPNTLDYKKANDLQTNQSVNHSKIFNNIQNKNMSNNHTDHNKNDQS